MRFLKQPPLYTRYSLYTLTSNSNFSNEKQNENLDIKIVTFIKQSLIQSAWLEEHHRIRS